MGIQTFPQISAATGLNSSQLFTSSGTWTVPDGVTSIFVRVRGGDGSRSSYSNASPYTSNGSTGGTTSVDTISAVGGSGGYYWQTSSVNASESGLPGVIVESFLSVTPSSTLTVTIGSGNGSHAVISWGE